MVVVGGGGVVVGGAGSGMQAATASERMMPAKTRRSRILLLMVGWSSGLGSCVLASRMLASFRSAFQPVMICCRRPTFRIEGVLRHPAPMWDHSLGSDRSVPSGLRAACCDELAEIHDVGWACGPPPSSGSRLDTSM